MEESTEKTLFLRPKDCKFDASDLPVVQSLVGLGYNESEIGMILGWQGKTPESWKISAGMTEPQMREAIDNGLKAADAMLVRDLLKEALGYEYTEVVEHFKVFPSFDPETGESTTKNVKVGEKRTKKHIPGNAKLAELLVTNRLPELFKRRSEMSSKLLEAKLSGEMTEQQIDGLVGRLIEAVQRKQIESTVVS